MEHLVSPTDPVGQILNPGFNSVTLGGNTTTAAGGTPAALNWYEEWSGPITFNFAAGYNPTSTTITISIVRIGRIVILHIPPVNTLGTGGTGSTFSSNANAIPARFIPAVAVDVWSAGLFVINSTNSQGAIGINPGNNGFSIGVNAGLGPFGNTLSAQYGTLEHQYVCWTMI